MRQRAGLAEVPLHHVPACGTILVVLMLSTIWTFNAFEPIYLLTGGGPADATMRYTGAGLRDGDRQHAPRRGVRRPRPDPPRARHVHRGRERADEPRRLMDERRMSRVATAAPTASRCGPDAVRLGAALQHGRHGRQDGPRDLRRLHLPAEAAHAGAVRAQARARVSSVNLRNSLIVATTSTVVAS